MNWYCVQASNWNRQDTFTSLSLNLGRLDWISLRNIVRLYTNLHQKKLLKTYKVAWIKTLAILLFILQHHSHSLKLHQTIKQIFFSKKILAYVDDVTSQDQCDQIGQFLKDLCYKREKLDLLNKTAVGIFWATFGENWATFYSNIWSHWSGFEPGAQDYCWPTIK